MIFRHHLLASHSSIHDLLLRCLLKMKNSASSAAVSRASFRETAMFAHRSEYGGFAEKKLTNVPRRINIFLICPSFHSFFVLVSNERRFFMRHQSNCLPSAFLLHSSFCLHLDLFDVFHVFLASFFAANAVFEAVIFERKASRDSILVWRDTWRRFLKAIDRPIDVIRIKVNQRRALYEILEIFEWSY